MPSAYAAPEFWEERYRAGQTPWEFSGVPPALTRFLAANPAAPGDTVLVPGCGSGQELSAFAAAGYRVWVTDIDPAAVAACDRLIWIEAGRIHADGTPAQILPAFTQAMTLIGERDADTDLAD